MGGGAFGFDAGVGGGDEFGKLARGRAVAEAIEVGVFLEGDEAVPVDMVQGSLQALVRGIG